MRRWVGGVTLVALAVTAYYLTHDVLHGPVNARSLHLSVNNVATDNSNSGHDEGRRCRRTLAAREWLCSVEEVYSSNSVDYLVRVHEGDSCWEGEITHPARGLPRRISGCVHLREEFF